MANRICYCENGQTTLTSTHKVKRQLVKLKLIFHSMCVSTEHY